MALIAAGVCCFPLYGRAQDMLRAGESAQDEAEAGKLLTIEGATGEQDTPATETEAAGEEAALRRMSSDELFK
ncbi:MAG: hypothetical protein MJA29_10095, partial [Candidatus Omnitrophica bacterium]|nr:hypothetical protein [Candidatus Omnitrophota bacterium]